MRFADLLSKADRVVQDRLGDAVRYAPRVGEPVDVQGVFDDVDVNAAVMGAAVMSSGPQVFLMLADLPTDPEGEDDPTITVKGTDYKVRDVKKDGQGGVLLLLREA